MSWYGMRQTFLHGAFLILAAFERRRGFSVHFWVIKILINLILDDL